MELHYSIDIQCRLKVWLKPLPAKMKNLRRMVQLKKVKDKLEMANKRKLKRKRMVREVQIRTKMKVAVTTIKIQMQV